MADEFDDIEPDLLRERLLMLAELGDITGKQAEAAAIAHGLEPFERKPELLRFDPKLKSHWSIMMVVAWIAWRDFELVRKQDPGFCAECFHWKYREWKDFPDKKHAEALKCGGYFLEARPPPTVRGLTLLDELLRGQVDFCSRAAMRVREALAALWRALSEDHLVAVGFNAQGAVVEIPSRAWVYLRLREEGGRDVLSYDAAGQPAPFTEVTLRRDDVLRLWPATGKTPEFPATVIDKGEQSPETAIKGIRRDKPSTSSQVGRVKWALSVAFPDGVGPDLTDKEIQRCIEPIFRANSWKLASIDSIARARGRRKAG
jgi:hypothetical protein